MDNNEVKSETLSFLPSFISYKDYNNKIKHEDVNALLNGLVKKENVPNDVFDKMRLRSVTRYYCPLFLIAGEMIVEFSYEKQQGDKTIKVSDTMESGAFLAIPCHRQGALPSDIILHDETPEQISFPSVNERELAKTAQEEGWKLELPEGVEADSLVNQYQKQMLALVKDLAMRILKDELHNPSKLKINHFEFGPNAQDEEIPGFTFCRQPVSIIEYEYNGHVFKAVYKKDELVADYPVDNDSKDVQLQFHKKMGICAIAIALMLILQFSLIHFWPVTLVVLAALGGVLYKFYRDLSKIQSASSDIRAKVRQTIKAEEMVAALKG